MNDGLSPQPDDPSVSALVADYRLPRTFLLACLAAAALAWFAGGLFPFPGSAHGGILTAMLVGGVGYAVMVAVSSTVRKTPGASVWMVAFAGAFAGASMAAFQATSDAAFILAASIVTFATCLMALFRDLDDKVKGSLLFFGFLATILAVFLLVK